MDLQLRPEEGDKPGWIDLSPISEVDIPPDQKYEFKPNSWINPKSFPLPMKLIDAKFNLEIKYKDILFLPHQTNFSFRTFQEKGKLIWKKVGPTDAW